MSQLVAIMVDMDTGEVVAPDGFRWPLNLLGTVEVPLMVDDQINPALITLPENVVTTGEGNKISASVLPDTVVQTVGGTIPDGKIANNVVRKEPATNQVPVAVVPAVEVIKLHASESAAQAAIAARTGDAVALFGSGGDISARRRIGDTFSTFNFAPM